MKVSTTKARAIRKVAVISKTGGDGAPDLASTVGAWFGEHGVEVRFDADTSKAIGADDAGFARTTLPADSDLAIVAGGDGTLLAVARAAAPLGIPILGINLGSLGFLTELQAEEMFAALERVLRGEYEIDERYALGLRFMRRGKLHSEYALLNDAVIAKSALARMITLDLRIDGEDVATYTADGLIISTPTGSTAYNLSAGGPILDPRMSAFVIAPICPHSMTHRPLVVPGSVRLEVELRDTGEEVYLTLDGQVGHPMESRDSLDIVQHERPVRLLRLPGRSFFEVLRRKLRWGSR